jgi:Transposase domain (DUF772)
VYAFLADHRHELFPAELFADLARQGGGHPSVPAEVIATVLVLQALEGLSDREAISALRRDIAWKVACGLRLDDEGFHPTVLVYWRARLRTSDRPRRIFEVVREVVEATVVLAGRCRRVLDSTVLEDAVATQDTVTQLVAAIRRSGGWCQGRAGSSWPPTTMTGRASQCAPGTTRRPPRRRCRGWSTTCWPWSRRRRLGVGRRAAEAVAPLALVAGQDVEPGQRPGSWRIARRVANDRVISTVDPQARHTRKTSARNATATRPTSPPNRRPGWSPRVR